MRLAVRLYKFFYRFETLRRLIRGLLRSFVRNSEVVVPVQDGPLEGYRISIIPGAGENSYWLGIWEKEIQRLIEMLACELQNCKAIYDIGAHIGFFSMVFAKCFPGATVIAFEPDIENSRRLVKNVSLNGLTDRIVLCPFAIHCESGVLAWLSSGASSFSRTVKTPILHRNLNTSSYKQRIFTLSLDDAVFSLNLPRPSIIKIDAEGAEGPILRGGYRTLTEVKPVLLLEIHDEENGRTVDDVLRPLNREVFCVELGQATNGILQPFPAHYLVRLR